MRAKLIFQPFQEHQLVRGGRLQTIAGTFLPQTIATAPQQEVLSVTFDDGDHTTVVIDPASPNTAKTNTMIVLFHGLGGSGNSGYNLRMSQKFRERGYDVARYFHRGSNPLIRPLAKQIYHCGSHRDLLTALRVIHKNYPDRRLQLIGFSLSGAALLNLLGREAATLPEEFPQMERALAVCPPLDLESSSQRLSRLSNVLFDRYFSLMLTKQIKHKERHIPDMPRFNISPWRGLRELDADYTAKMGGFKSRSHYYETSSPARVLDHIAIPTTILGASDDPIICPKAFEQGTSNQKVDIILTAGGGHMGFISQIPTTFGDHRWMDEFVLTWATSAH